MAFNGAMPINHGQSNCEFNYSRGEWRPLAHCEHSPRIPRINETANEKRPIKRKFFGISFKLQNIFYTSDIWNCTSLSNQRPKIDKKKKTYVVFMYGFP